MKMKRILALVLAAGLCLSLLAMPVGAASTAATTFSDVSDGNTAVAVESLRLLGVLDGYGDGTFRPDNSLTRAQFCKMAVYAMNLSSELGKYRSVTVFPDVKPSHWAASYVNLAAKGKAIIAGYADGYFRPDNVVTFAQAVTILVRVLGYSDADVGGVWPDGYLAQAATIGLTDGLSLSAGTALTRANAARLFANLLAAEKKDSSSYASSICASVISNVVLVSCSATASDGTGGAMQTSGGTIYKMANKSGSGVLNGRRGQLLLDKNGKVLTFVPDSGGSTAAITLAAAKSDSVTDSSGKKYTIASTATAYYNGETTTYGAIYAALPTGITMTLYFGASGAVEYVFIGTATASTAAVVVYAKGDTSGFSELAGGNSYTIYKNGLKSGAGDLRPYDVAVYDGLTGAIRVCDTRITGYYESCSPNASAPTSVTVLGHSFTVLSTAVDTLSKFKPGNQITLLLTEDNKVAGAVAASGSTALGNATGLVTSLSASSATVQLLCGLTVTGDPQLSASQVSEYAGQLVRVSSSGAGGLSLSRLIGSSSSVLDVSTRKLGGTEIAANAVVYEKVDTSALTAISLSDIRTATVASSKISYVGKDWAGRVNILVLDDVTGNCFTYGKPVAGSGTLGVEYGNGKTLGPVSTGYGYNGDYIGMVLKGDGSGVVKVVSLDKVSGVANSSWSGNTLVAAGGRTYPVATDAVCYNKAAKSWLTITQGRAYAATSNLYVDEHGVVRVMEVGG